MYRIVFLYYFKKSIYLLKNNIFFLREKERVFLGFGTQKRKFSC